MILLAALPVRGATVDPDSLRRWTIHCEARLRANDTEGIESESQDWIHRLEDSAPPRPALLAEALRIRLAVRSLRGLAGDTETLETAQRLVTLYEELDVEDGRMVMALVGLGSSLSTRGNYAAATEPLQRATRLAESLDPTSAELGTALSHQAWNLRLLGRLDDAERVALHSLEVRQALGPEQAASASWNYNQLASIALARGALDRALEYGRACLRLREEHFGAQSLWTGDSCEMLGWILTQRGEYPAADSFSRRALEIFQSTVGEESDRVARTWNDLGVTASYRAQHDVARRYFERALDVRTRLYGPSNVSVAQTLHNLGVVLADIGDDEAALDRQRRALSILDAQDLKTSEDALQCRTEIVRLLVRRRSYDAARSVAEPALADAMRAFGPESIAAISARLLLADLEERAGDLGRALAEADSVATLANAPGMHLLRAEALYRRARLLRSDGAVDRALVDADSARALRVRAFGPSHPDAVRSTLLLGELMLQRGEVRRALDLALDAEAQSRRHATSLFDGFAQRQALGYAAERPSGLSLALRCFDAAAEDMGPPLWRLWDCVLESRGLVLRAMTERARDARLLASGPGHRLQEARGRVARLVMTSLRAESDVDPAQVRAAIADRERLERAVGDSIDARVGRTPETGSTKLRDLVAELAEGEALVGFRRVDDPDQPRRYVAFVARADAVDPTLVDLGDASELEELIARWMTELRRGETRPDRSPRESRRACRAAGAAVRQRVFDPLLSSIVGATEVFVVPDAALWEIPWAALPLGEDRYLVEESPRVRLLLSERDLRANANGVGQIRTVLAVGGVDYDGVDGTLPEGVHLAPLPRSREESEAIRDLWSGATTICLRAARADEAAVSRELAFAELSHLATHALYLQDDGTQGELAGNPLLRSGLVLAGDPASGPHDDGWLSAEEICGLDLHRSRLVVLSACSTGRGRTLAGEATLGLAWAFRVAGVRNLVLAGWEVGDQEALDWMRSFHTGLREGGSIAEAAQASSRALLAELRSHGRSTHPHHWAAFRAIETHSGVEEDGTVAVER